MCGGERTGCVRARALFRGATWFVTPGAEARPELFERLHGLIGSVGARPVAIDAGVHDRLMALVSHLPHVLAGALVNQAADTAPEGREALRSAGPSFGEPPASRLESAAWADILIANREAPPDAPRVRGGLGGGGGGAARGDRDWLLRFIGDAAEARTACARPDVGPADPPAWWRSPTGRGRSPRSRPCWGTRTSTSRTSTCGRDRPTARGSWSWCSTARTAREEVRAG